jgi:hypothetical protein
MKKTLLYIALVVLYLLHNDLWNWNDGHLVGGIPVGLLYHIVYCLVASLMMILLVRYAWPAGLEAPEGKDRQS